MLQEQRVHKRFSVKENAFVTFNENYSLGKVRDVSEGGFSFEYISTDEFDRADLYKNSSMSIWTTGNNISLGNIPCKIVYDFKTREIDLKQKFESRRCGVQFLYTDEDIINELKKMHDEPLF
ncbi:MAG: PilZ domain-containing protein [Thermodesulfobacteriota bacterium]